LGSLGFQRVIGIEAGKGGEFVPAMADRAEEVDTLVVNLRLRYFQRHKQFATVTNPHGELPWPEEGRLNAVNTIGAGTAMLSTRVLSRGHFRMAVN
jgi:hypothetical protein